METCKGRQLTEGEMGGPKALEVCYFVCKKVFRMIFVSLVRWGPELWGVKPLGVRVDASTMRGSYKSLSTAGVETTSNL